MMKKVTIDTHSRWFTRPWHLQLATAYGTSDDGEDARYHLYRNGTTICEYTRRVLQGASIVAAMLAVSSVLLLYPIASFCAWLAALIMHGGMRPDEPALVVLVLLFACAVVVGVYKIHAGCVILSRVIRPERFSTPQQLSVLNEMFTNWKQKTCVQVEFAHPTQSPSGSNVSD